MKKINDDFDKKLRNDLIHIMKIENEPESIKELDKWIKKERVDEVSKKVIELYTIHVANDWEFEGGIYLLGIRIEFLFEEERLQLLDDLQKIGYVIADEGKIKKSKKAGSKKLIQYLDIQKQSN